MKLNNQLQQPATLRHTTPDYKKWLKNRQVKALLGINDASLKQYINLGLIETYQPHEGANRLYNPEDIQQFIRKR
ncbi:MAG: MerR family transcriptional regulator [Chitinophagaceae bacterium]|nr:MerR family transcriptional regulator [Chitinophagaceae bacterium]